MLATNGTCRKHFLKFSFIKSPTRREESDFDFADICAAFIVYMIGFYGGKWLKHVNL